MAALMQDAGYETTEDPGRADLILVNTCSIRDKAEQKIYSRLGRFRPMKESNPDLLIGVGGCLAQQRGERLFRRAPHLDLVFGTHQIHRLPELIGKRAREGGRIVETAFCERVPSLDIPAQPAPEAIGTFVTIMQGCDNFCAYCVVPYLRGPEESRPLIDIVREVEGLAARGIREVTLLGQNVNSYGRTLAGSADFADLLGALGKVEGIERIRFTTSHPKDLSQRLIDCFGEVPSLCEHIHLPFQAGSDRVLERMKRGYSAREYLKKISALRRRCPRIRITSDAIVGFPGEEEEDFQATLALMREVRFDNLFSFRYSKREGTAAAGMDGTPDEKVKRERLRTLQSLQEEHTLERNRALIGKLEEVLVEGPSRNSPREMTGRTRGNGIVNFPGDGTLIGRTVPVRIVEAFLHSLRGEEEERGGSRCSLR
jgi:tRNA-2-methylthio-N6-dimethylallyladenosine synthase